MTTTNVEKAINLLKAFETGDPAALDLISDEQYIQHNVNFPSGKAALGPFFGGQPTGITVDVKRRFTDGEHVILHSKYAGSWNNGTPQVAFDVFRFADGKIVEHWDNLSNIATVNVSGHTQLDGETTVTELDKTAANKAFVREFVDKVLVNEQYDVVGNYYTPNVIQHNSNVGDGIDGLVQAITAMAEQGITMVYDKIHHVFGQGNFVLTISEGAFGGQPTAYYDLFRMQDGMIVEHWDILETLTENAHREEDARKF